jgi:hypothetical protein
MGSKLLVAAGVCLVALLTYSTVLKIKDNAKQDFSIITWKEHDVCFLVPDTFTIEKQANGFKYKGGKNSGHLVLSQGQIADDYKKTMIGDFEAGYKKTRNYRYFQYLIGPGLVLSDTFDFAYKKPANIIPVRKNCKEYLKRFKVLFEF